MASRVEAQKKTKEQRAIIKRRAFEIYCSNPDISNAKLSKDVGVEPITISRWLESDEWIEWRKKVFSAIDVRLKHKLIALDDKFIRYIDGLLTGSLDKEELRGASAVVNIFKSRLEIAGFVNKKAGIEINNNLIGQQQINNVAIENMSENQVFKYVTTGEIPKNIEDLSLVKKDKTLDLEALGIKTIS